MFGRRQRREERLYWKGFRDAVAEVRKLSLTPGDTLVLKLGKPLSAKAAREIKDNLEGRFPDNKILVCDADIDLSVVNVVKLDGKVVTETAVKAAKSEAARA